MKDKTRVLIIEPNGEGNISHHSLGLCASLSQKGFQVTLATSCSLEFQRHQSFHFDLRKIIGKGFLGYFYSLYLLMKLFFEKNPHVVYIQDFGFLPLEIPLVALLKRIFNCRVIFTAHNILPHEKRLLKLWLYAKFYKIVDIIVTHNDYDKRIISELFSIVSSKIFTVPRGNYLLFEQYFNNSPEAVRKDLNIPDGSNVILFFGYITRGKGLDILLKAFRELIDVIPDCRLIVAGKVCHKDYYEGLIQDLGIAGHMVIDWKYIPMEQVVKYFAASHVVVLPYRKICESPIVQMAYTFRKPIIKSAHVYDHSFVEGENGYSVLPGDVISLTEALVKLFSDKEKLKKMSLNVREIAEKTHSWESLVSITETVPV